MKHSGQFLLILLFIGLSTGVWGQNNSSFNDEPGPSVVTQETEHSVSAPITLSDIESGDFIKVYPDPKNNTTGNGSMSLMAVPANNNCANAIALTVDAACVNGTTKEANMQSGESTACQGTLTQSVWYTFVATGTTMYVEVERLSSSGCYLSSAVYSANCLPSSASAISCEDAAFGPNLNIHNLTGLTVGNTYRIQVGYRAGSGCGNGSNVNTGANFCIKVGTPKNCATCNSPCGPTCIFATAPTVAQVVANCPQYNLEPRLNSGQSRTQCYTFTAVATSFNLQMIINASGCGVGNVSSFNWSLYPDNCSGVLQSGNLSNLNATGLVIGASYKLCYSWTASCQHNSVYPYIVATSPLPIKLLYFDGFQEEKSVLLNWITASEVNNNYFSIQRSSDGTEFKEIGRVQGAGNSNNILKYAYTDKDPMIGINYYRLIQYDYDNQFSSSEIIAVRYNAKFHIQILNNPANMNLEISSYNEKEARTNFSIINSQGQTVLSIDKDISPGYSMIEIPLNKISKGSYILKTDHPSGSKWLKFVKI